MGTPYLTVLFLRNALKLNMTFLLLFQLQVILRITTSSRSQLGGVSWTGPTLKLSVELSRHEGSGVCPSKYIYLMTRIKIKKLALMSGWH